MTTGNPRINQCSKPSGLLGGLVLWRMNSSHSKVTDWGLQHLSIDKQHTILDVGCGGGRTVAKLAAIAAQGTVYGIDYSSVAVTATRRMNAQSIQLGRVNVLLGSVSQLPFSDGTFDVVTAVETHFWWPDLCSDLREVLRVMKPGGTLLIIAEVYKNPNTAKFVKRLAAKTGLILLSAAEHRELLEDAGYTDIRIIEETRRGWICCLSAKPH